MAKHKAKDVILVYVILPKNNAVNVFDIIDLGRMPFHGIKCIIVDD